MSRTHKQIEIGNLVVKFGADLKLLDLFDEIIGPAFFDDSLQRKYGDTSYLFHKPRLIKIKDEVCLIGRLVKNTVLLQQQILVGNNLKSASGSMPSSPSSLFVLVLSCHRLIFVKEHKGSPGTKEFKATFSWHLKKKYGQFIRSLSQILDPEKNVKPTLKELRIKYPFPTVDLTPIGSEESLVSFVHKFKTLEVITASLLATNDETDNADLFRDIRSSNDRIRSHKTTLRYENTKTGLNKAEAIDQLTVLAKQGNHSLKLIGHDKNGEKLSGNNENFKVESTIESLPHDPKEAGETLFGHFEDLKKDKIISIPSVEKSTTERIKKIWDSANK
ncbi:MAG: hypothetical protein V4507_00630 [Verrucomicrobiota bacterium]